jgi:hypothetical protein
MSTPDDPAAAILAGIRERAKWTSSADGIAAPGATAEKSARDVPALLGAVERLLEVADDWTAESDELDDLAEKPGTDEEGRPIMQGQAMAYSSCAQDLRETITAALAGKEGTGGEVAQ